MIKMAFRSVFWAHSTAAACSLYYAWLVSQSAYVKTGLQFVAPLLVIMVVHLCWVAVRNGLPQGFSVIVFRRTLQSSFAMACVLGVGSVIAPQPAVASDSRAASALLIVVFCVAMIVAVVAILAAIGFILFKGGAALLDLFRQGGDSDPKSRFFDFGSLAVAFGVLCVCSLEGLPHAYSFSQTNRSEASHLVAASPAQVWATLEQATQPSFPLPEVLRVFPQPVEVVIDEGVALGAMRKVKFEGREGQGYLTLQVVERSEDAVVFKVLSDSSPFATWLKHRHLTYHVQAEPHGTRVSVSLEYDRLLAPSWFFTPVTKGAAYLAMDVLARDVMARAES
ncbi:SRPBCC family protein [uncultured Litoreibacter sp.]|uniref:SRPBCC family protein n=1 Tax=uncultured Litoreibacter sp. TaxID=1392394 RepID=UPI00260B8C74|nr:SRPBCC family protein [uncultured Litoreibacter sp.]